MSLVSVVVNLPRKSGKQILHYLLPENIKNKVQIGCRVIVPLGNSEREGYVIGFPSESPVKKLKEIIDLVDIKPVISQEMLHLAFWVSEHYLCPLHKILDYVLPPSFRLVKEKYVSLKEQKDDSLIKTVSILDEKAKKIFIYLSEGPCQQSFFIKKMGQEIEPVLEDLQNRGLIDIYWDFKNKKNKKEISIVEIIDSQITLASLREKLKNAPKQLLIMKFLLEKQKYKLIDLQKELGVNYASINSLVNKGLIRKYKEREIRVPEISKEFKNEQKIKLTPQQKKIVREINKYIEKKETQKFLLHGVTGSGKTEIYLNCIKYALAQGRGALVLVPEISLTPQTIGRFKSVLGGEVVVLHSKISEGERQDAWEALQSGQARVAIGVRSGVFAPVKNLGIIVIDEEHENTFKQSEPDPRYHARSVAIKRIENVGGVLLLGSATPSIDSYYQAQEGDFKLLELPERINKKALPKIEIIDMREELQKGNKSIFSEQLKKEIEKALHNEEQIILFLNRRGFSTYVFCRECGKALQCPNCSITLTYHAVPGDMRCHYCNHREAIPRHCPYCGSKFIRYFGAGTQQVEDELKKIWPQIKVTRMDADTTQKKNAHQELLAEFKKRHTQILVGTQMIAKGLDFPNVTLVGVLAADTTLNLPDYKSSEKTFQLLTQVAGRAGRGEKEGRVIIQTYSPEHYSIQEAQKQNYKSFYSLEIQQRKDMLYPPFNYLIRVIVSGFQEDTVEDITKKLNKYILTKYNGQLEVYGPAPAPIQKIKQRFRWHLILKGKDLEILKNAVKWGYIKIKNFRKDKSLRIVIDVEPENIL